MASNKNGPKSNKPLTKDQMEKAMSSSGREDLDEIPVTTYDKYQHDAGHKGGD